ncbi:ABC transporter substrate-binding protein [Dongshaea marina]|uniref:ABC transporter substrate-binding protein n=1 Tax=Dongshaea marina TaxID=2047966 RepID=UPI001902B0D9|nr:ABC transporter substrate-binding protein [Dongshaea marina]
MRVLPVMTLLLLLHSLMLPGLALGDEAAARRWVELEFSPSTLTREQQLKEMRWFIQAAKPFRGMTIRVVSERIATHWYEASVLAKAFYQITGIRLVHELTGEDDVIKKLQTQLMIGENLYDAYINDSDLIGTHSRSQKILVLSDFMQEEGRDVTLPTLDLDDFIGLAFTTGADGKLYQLPDQQFANLYWYRHDWFSRPDLKQRFRKLYGYELDVPVNWSAYEDIADFFSHHVKELDGKPVYGHMDYAKTDPSLGWRISDAWLSMAGVGDKGLPNGLPVDEWGIRMQGCHPVGLRLPGEAPLMDPRHNMRSVSLFSGYRPMHRRRRLISILPRPDSGLVRGRSPSRSSGTPHLSPISPGRVFPWLMRMGPPSGGSRHLR